MLHTTTATVLLLLEEVGEMLRTCDVLLPTCSKISVLPTGSLCSTCSVPERSLIFLQSVAVIPCYCLVGSLEFGSQEAVFVLNLLLAFRAAEDLHTVPIVLLVPLVSSIVHFIHKDPHPRPDGILASVL